MAKLKEVSLDNVPVSDITLKGMTWSSDDRQFLKRALQYNNNNVKKYIKDHITDTSNELAEALIARDKKMFDKMDEQTAIMRDMKVEMDSIKSTVGVMQNNYQSMLVTIKKLDKRTNPVRVWVIRVVMFFAAVVVGSLIFYFLFPWVHNHYLLKGLLTMINF